MVGLLAKNELPAEGCSIRNGKWEEGSRQKMILDDNRTHYTIIQSTVRYDTQLTNDSLTTPIVFHSRNYTDSFL